jgi:hypothetical protein
LAAAETEQCLDSRSYDSSELWHTVLYPEVPVIAQTETIIWWQHCTPLSFSLGTTRPTSYTPLN